MMMPERSIHKKYLIITLLLGTIPALSLLWAGLDFLFEAIDRPEMPFDDDAIISLQNSAAIATITTVFSTIISTYLSFFRSQFKLILIACLIFLFTPGQLVALGLQYLVTMIGPAASDTLRGASLLISLVVYTLPFQIIIIHYSVQNISEGEWHAAEEFLDHFDTFKYYISRNVSSIYSSILVCWALSFTDGVRTAILSGDYFGFGSKMFTPNILSKFNGGGFTDVFHLISTIIYVFAIFATIKASMVHND